MLGKVEVRKPGSCMESQEYEKTFQERTKDVIFKIKDLLEKEYLDEKVSNGRMQWLELGNKLSNDEGGVAAYCARFLCEDGSFDESFCSGNAYIFADIRANKEHRNVYVYFSENLSQHLAEDGAIVSRLGEKFPGVNIILHGLNAMELNTKTAGLKINFLSIKNVGWNCVAVILTVAGAIASAVGISLNFISSLTSAAIWTASGLGAVLLGFLIVTLNTIDCKANKEH